jgi:hypothetical protein
MVLGLAILIFSVYWQTGVIPLSGSTTIFNICENPHVRKVSPKREFRDANSDNRIGPGGQSGYGRPIPHLPLIRIFIAIARFWEVLRIKPDFKEVRLNLSWREILE